MEMDPSYVYFSNETTTMSSRNATAVPSIPGGGYSMLETIVFAGVAGILSFLTIFGNVLVMVSFKLDKQLQTISNYFLLSLAVADFLIGLISMPLYTLYLLLNKWPLGPFVCDTWLALDYLNSNASVLNLLVISFDRYFSVTRPLTYRVRRTTRRACLMIASTWFISLLLWPPWIFAWPYIEGKRTVPETECYIQFLETNLYITFGTALAAFYIPVTVMCFLYWRIWRETEKRYKDLTTLFLVSAVGGRVRTTAGHSHEQGKKTGGGKESSHRRFIGIMSRGSSKEQQTEVSIEEPGSERERRGICRRCFTIICWPFLWVWNYFSFTAGDEEDDDDETTTTAIKKSARDDMTSTTEDDEGNDECDTTSASSYASRGLASDSIYTILITLGSGPKPTAQMTTPTTTSSAALTPVAESTDDGGHSIKQFFETALINSGSKSRETCEGGQSPKMTGSSRSKRLSTSSATPRPPPIQSTVSQPKAEKKAAKTLSAILLAFIITWTPYNVLVLVKTLYGDSIDEDSSVPQISQGLWNFSYYLCYINSTINPFCYALCNVNFRNTYLRILKCQWTLKATRAKRAAANIDAQYSVTQAAKRRTQQKNVQKQRQQQLLLVPKATEQHHQQQEQPKHKTYQGKQPHQQERSNEDTKKTFPPRQKRPEQQSKTNI